MGEGTTVAIPGMVATNRTFRRPLEHLEDALPRPNDLPPQRGVIPVAPETTYSGRADGP